MPVSNLELTELFFKDLKSYNTTNFRTLANATLIEDDPVVHKAYSSVITRYWIFCDKHPEVSVEDRRMLYFKLKLDMIGQYFSEYPDGDLDMLRSFQIEVQQYIKRQKYKQHNSDAKVTGVVPAVDEKAEVM